MINRGNRVVILGVMTGVVPVSIPVSIPVIIQVIIPVIMTGITLFFMPVIMSRIKKLLSREFTDDERILEIFLFVIRKWCYCTISTANDR